MILNRETVKRPLDECSCDWCGAPNHVGDEVFVDLEHGTVYCCRACAEHDHFDRGYGTTAPGVSRWDGAEE